MWKLLSAVVANVLRARGLLPGAIRPMVATLYVTPLCNLDCGYCHEFGKRRNADYRGQTLDTADLKRVLSLLRPAADLLYLTGGEPTLRPDLAEILRHARRLGFFRIAMNTNGLTLPENENLLPLLDHLVISMDSRESGRHGANLDATTVEDLAETVRWAARRQREHGFRLSVTSVLHPWRADEFRRVRDFCFSVGVQFSPQWLSCEQLPHPDLARDPEISCVTRELLEAKRAGLPVSGTRAYLQAKQTGAAYVCAPTGAPHVDWRGHLAYPCRELEDHVSVDLLAAGSFKAAMAEAVRRYGPPPAHCNRCGERCYVEMSLLLRQPREMLRLLREQVLPPSERPSRPRRTSS